MPTLKKTAPILHKQIEAINPDVIINGSRIWKPYPSFKPDNYKNINTAYYCISENKILINAFHPNAREKKEIYFDDILECYKVYARQCLK